MLPLTGTVNDTRHRIADPLGNELLEGLPRLEDAFGRHSGLGYAQMQRHVRPLDWANPRFTSTTSATCEAFNDTQ